jgi:hypothetical protein
MSFKDGFGTVFGGLTGALMFVICLPLFLVAVFLVMIGLFG